MRQPPLVAREVAAQRRTEDVLRSEERHREIQSETEERDLRSVEREEETRQALERAAERERQVEDASDRARRALKTAEEEREALYESLWQQGSFQIFLKLYSDIAVNEASNKTLSDFVRKKITRKCHIRFIKNILRK